MWMTRRKKPKATIKNSLNPFVGFFENIEDPLWRERFDSKDMTFELLVRYGDRMASSYITYFKQGDAEIPLTQEQASYLANLLYKKYYENWKRKFDVLDASYQMVDNYAMKEKETVDRDTLDTRINEILKTNTESRNQLAELLETVKRHEENVKMNTGSDVITGNTSEDTTNHNETTTDKTVDASGSDTLTFVDRKDTEDVYMHRTGDNTEHEEADNSNTLTFNNRKDSNYNKLEINNRVDESSHTDDLTQEKGSSSNGRDVYGLGGGPAPEHKEAGKTENRNDRDIDVDGNTITKGDQTNNGHVNKNGSEINTIEVNSDKTFGIDETDDGKNTTTKTGSEITGRNSHDDIHDSTITDASGNTSGNMNQTTTYDTKEENQADATADNSSTNNVTEDSLLTENQAENERLTGTMQEVRTVERTGNIGVTTTYQLLKGHVDFWKYNFLDELYQDVINELALDIFEGTD